MATRTTKQSQSSRTRKAPTKTAPKPEPQSEDNAKFAAMKESADAERNGMTVAQRKALASKIARLRQQHVRWDGEGGICEQTGIRSALVGRSLLREFGQAALIKPLTGSRAPGA